MDEHERCSCGRIATNCAFIGNSSTRGNYCTECADKHKQRDSKGFGPIGPMKFFPMKFKAILESAAKRKEFEGLQHDREKAISLLVDLLNVSDLAQGKLLHYFDVAHLDQDETDAWKMQFSLRYQQVNAVLRKLADSLESCDYWIGQPIPFVQAILNSFNEFRIVILRAVLPFPALVYEEWLMNARHQSDFTNALAQSVSREETNVFLSALTDPATQESKVDDAAVLQYSSTWLRKYLSTHPDIPTDPSSESLVHSALGVTKISDVDRILSLVPSAWKAPALSFTGYLFASSCYGSNIPMAARFLCKHFPDHKAGVALCKLWMKRSRSEEKLSIHLGITRSSTERERNASLSCLMLLVYRRTTPLDDEEFSFFANSLTHVKKFADVEVAYVHRAAKRQSFEVRRKIRALYSKAN